LDKSPEPAKSDFQWTFQSGTTGRTFRLTEHVEKLLHITIICNDEVKEHSSEYRQQQKEKNSNQSSNGKVH
jgi:hypothetical protein